MRKGKRGWERRAIVPLLATSLLEYDLLLLKLKFFGVIYKLYKTHYGCNFHLKNFSWKPSDNFRLMVEVRFYVKMPEESGVFPALHLGEPHVELRANRWFLATLWIFWIGSWLWLTKKIKKNWILQDICRMFWARPCQNRVSGIG